VIVLSVHDEPNIRRAVLDAGADAFVLKRAIVTDLLPAVDRLREEMDAAATGNGGPPDPVVTRRRGWDEERVSAEEPGSSHRGRGRPVDRSG